MAVDGELLNDHFCNGRHILGFTFQDLEAHRDFYNSPSYRIGYKALIEGAGMASEWLYDLQKGNITEDKARREMSRYPDIYLLALRQIQQILPGKSLLEHLILLSVLVDISINPFLPRKTWPNIFGANKGKDILPGFRFQRMLGLLHNQLKIDFTSKKEIAEYLFEVTKSKLGWNEPVLAFKELRRLLSSAKSTLASWNPLDTFKEAIDIRIQHPVAYIAPVDSAVLNRSNTNPQIILVAPGYIAQEKEALFTYLELLLPEILLRNLVYDNKPICPACKNSWLKENVRLGNHVGNICCYNANPPDNINEPIHKWKQLGKCACFRKLTETRLGIHCGNIEYI